MTDRDLIARCPGCGKGKEIAMALGQLLQCDICRTVFHAPVATDGETDPEALSDAFVVQPATATQEPPAAGPRSALPNSMAGGTKFSGHETNLTRTRAWRAHDLGMSAAPEPTDRTEKNIASVNSAGPPETPDAINDAKTPGTPWSAVAVFGVGIAGIAVVTATFFLMRLPSRSAASNPVASTSPPERDGSVHWTNAAKYRQRKHPVTLHVEQVKYGSLRAKDASNQVLHTEDDNLLGITVGVHNQGTRPRAFKNWYGHAFETDQGGTVVAQLTDNHDRAYSLLKFDDVRRVEGQSHTDSIDPKETAQDTVVFMIPEALDRSRIKYFRLKLPGAAVGLSESFRFHIPTSMVEGFAAP